MAKRAEGFAALASAPVFGAAVLSSLVLAIAGIALVSYARHLGAISTPLVVSTFLSACPAVVFVARALAREVARSF